MEEIRAMTFIDLVSLVDCEDNSLRSLFSSALCLDRSCIAVFILWAVSAARISNICSI